MHQFNGMLLQCFIICIAACIKDCVLASLGIVTCPNCFLRMGFRRQATVGAGLPVLSTLQTLRATGDRVARMEGVLSGTLSYLFNTFAPGQRFSALVADARRRGFTEPDPRDDLSGMKLILPLLYSLLL